jgi:hypothetical protein
VTAHSQLYRGPGRKLWPLGRFQHADAAARDHLLTVQPVHSRVPKRLETRVLALLRTFLDRVVADVPLTGYEGIMRRMEALALLASYHTPTTSRKTEIDAARHMADRLAFVRILLANNALLNRTDLECETLEWVAAHLMSADPLQRALATAMRGWIAELP